MKFLIFKHFPNEMKKDTNDQLCLTSLFLKESTLEEKTSPKPVKQSGSLERMFKVKNGAVMWETTYTLI